MNSVPVQVMRTRLQDSQKLCVSGVMKPSRPPVSLHAHIAGRPAGAVVDLVEGEALGQPGAHHRQRQILVEPAFADIAERHHLDEA